MMPLSDTLAVNMTPTEQAPRSTGSLTSGLQAVEPVALMPPSAVASSLLTPSPILSSTPLPSTNVPGSACPSSQTALPVRLSDTEFVHLLRSMLTGPLAASATLFPFLHGYGPPSSADPQPRPLLLLRVGPTPLVRRWSREGMASFKSDESKTIETTISIEEGSQAGAAQHDMPNHTCPTFLNTVTPQEILVRQAHGGWQFKHHALPIQYQSRNFSSQPGIWACLADIVVYGVGGTNASTTSPPVTGEMLERVAACVCEAQAEFAARIRASVPNWELRRTSIFYGDCIAIEAQVPEAISIRSDGTRLFWCDMLQREAASMYELAAPVQVSPHVWFGHDRPDVSDTDKQMPLGKSQLGMEAAILLLNNALDDIRDDDDDDDESLPIDSDDDDDESDGDTLQGPGIKESGLHTVMTAERDSHLSYDSSPSTASVDSHSAVSYVETTIQTPSPSIPTTAHSASSSSDASTSTPYFHYVIRLATSVEPICRANLEKHLAAAQHASNTATTYTLYVPIWNPRDHSGMCRLLLDIIWYMRGIVEICKKTGQRLLIYYDFSDDSFLYASSLVIAHVMFQHRLSLAAASLHIQRSSHVYISGFREGLQELEDEMWMQIELERNIGTDGDYDLLLGPIDGQNEMKIESPSNIDWFYHTSFDGTFPSQVLPYLLLGDIGQASNKGLLKALGVTHILSVGICPVSIDDSMVHLYLDHIEDDGFCSLTSHIDTCNQFIDQARAKNGRVFMHCQVGTSRSASLAIAYVMYRCGLSLLDAYLLVRARRLLLVIQPNLLFVYNLLEYERQLYGRISLPWLDLARGIALLNSSC